MLSVDVGGLLILVCFLLSHVRWWLFAASCLLRVVCCLLFGVGVCSCCHVLLLFVAEWCFFVVWFCCVLFCRLLLIVCCSLFALCCLMCVARFVLFVGVCSCVVVVARWSLFVGGCLLLFDVDCCWLLFRCLLFCRFGIVCCLLVFVVCCLVGRCSSLFVGCGL